MLDYSILISFVIATATLAFSPGPDNIFVLIQSSTYGKTSGMAVVFGLMTGCLVHTTLVAFGVSAFIQSNEAFFWILKGFGALYMIYLAGKVYQSKEDFEVLPNEAPPQNSAQLFQQGFVMNVLNPKVSIFFLAFFPAFLFSDSLSLLVQIYILGFVFIVTSFFVFSFFVLLSGFFSKVFLNTSDQVKRLKLLQMAVFIGIAVLILFG